ncbi:hypothetical protein DGG96_16690 [Legionella qingyii]|uniref:Uncharacterized protein n=1 Tax=Legionella qingyii TaxID=2184757 RepID=A0A317TY38_9GAMM|nr:hypothetical protein DGG96_16690 [Legionella qingyii]
MIVVLVDIVGLLRYVNHHEKVAKHVIVIEDGTRVIRLLEENYFQLRKLTEEHFAIIQKVQETNFIIANFSAR